jgi:hypothetical protein
MTIKQITTEIADTLDNMPFDERRDELLRVHTTLMLLNDKFGQKTVIDIFIMLSNYEEILKDAEEFKR